ncbi:DUF1653 domain-containing protein [Patescibacteria group bacterium]|nr:DUF1653 domain-containing protein [Patescibacteria group bacterium]
MSAIPSIRPDSEYLHFKGGRYFVVGVAHDATNAEEDKEVVVYRSMTDGALYVRAVSEFLELVRWENGQMRPRFVPAEEA